MAEFKFTTDSTSGAVEAESLQAALEAVVRDERVTDAAIDDGAFAWVEDAGGNRLYVAEQNAF